VKRFYLPIVLSLAVALVSIPAAAQSVDDSAAWRTLAEKLEGGTTVRIQLRDGQRFKATFIEAQRDTVVVQRRTRVPVPVEAVSYDLIASMSRVDHSGMSAAKVTGIALGSAGATIGVFFLILLASLD
jgi:hypothetical protein